MHSIQQLQSGELAASQYIKIADGLQEVPSELLSLSDTLQMLDLSQNKLSSLPSFFSELKQLKILFLSDNNFEVFPDVLGSLPNLEMIGIKNNQLSSIPENALPEKLKWLTLTNNQINALPKSIGNCTFLQKFILSGNQLSELPVELAQCRNLELLRLSANQFKELPEWLFNMPKLAWLAYSGNPFNEQAKHLAHLPHYSWENLLLHEKIGEGASGNIYRVQSLDSNPDLMQRDYALKIFKGELTSDGLPVDEMNACILAAHHPNLLSPLARLSNHPQQKSGLLFELLNKEFKNLGNPPSFQTCSRDTFDKDLQFSFNQFIGIASQIASVMIHLHQRGIMHGDLYAHNILINRQKALLSDFGAATLYDKHDDRASLLERIDVRAFGYLLDDLLTRTVFSDSDESNKSQCFLLRQRCLNENIVERPDFLAVVEFLEPFISRK